MLITGDCSRSICNAWLSVVSKTGSPVLLIKSARMIESLVALAVVPAALSPAGGRRRGAEFPPCQAAGDQRQQHEGWQSTRVSSGQHRWPPPALPDCGSSPSSASCSCSAVA